MRKSVFLLASLVLATVLVAGAALGASTKVWLTPKPNAGPSDAFPLKGGGPGGGITLGEDYLLSYDTGAEGGVLGGLSTTDTIAVWFQSPAACTLLEIRVDLYSAGDFDMFAADVYDTIDMGADYSEYHGGPGAGPAPIESVFDDSTGLSNPGQQWHTLNVTSRPDVGTNVFLGGYVLKSAGAPAPIIDASIPQPPEGYHTLMARIPSGGTPADYGWYSSWHHAYVRALVSLYENPGPFITSYTRLPDTYRLGGRHVAVAAWDIGVPGDSVGVAEMRLLYSVNGVGDTVLLTRVLGDSTNGTWSGYLPSASAWDTITYNFEAVDYQGVASASNSTSYVVRAGQPTAELLFINDDYYGANGYDPIAAMVPDTIYDIWEAGQYGVPDASVIGFGYKAILWNTWDGALFVQDTLLIEQFLTGGGALWVSSQDLPAGSFGYSWGAYATAPGEWLHDHLHLMGGVDDHALDTVSVYFGVPGDPISGDFADWPITSFPYGWAGAGYNYAGSCLVDPNDLNVSGIFYDVGDPITGYKYDLPGGYKIVFLYWPFNELVNLDGSVDTTSQDILVGNVMTWFGVDPVGIAERLKERLSARSSHYLLWQNYPNPANGPTTISFNIPQAGKATLKIYDSAGRLVNTLADEFFAAGRHTMQWDGRDKLGNGVSSGVYIYRLSAGRENMAKKLVYIR